MLRENLKDTGEILLNILSQPLSIPGVDRPISLLEAAKKFDPSNPAASDLQKVFATFTEYKESTNTLLEELSLLSKDLNL